MRQRVSYYFHAVQHMEMMMYTITLNNMAGELESKAAQTPEQAAQAAIDLIKSCGVLYSGDSIQIIGGNDDE